MQKPDTFLSENKKNITMFLLYFILMPIPLVVTEKSLLLAFIMEFSIPFVIWAVISAAFDKSYKRLILIPICLIVIVLTGIFQGMAKKPTDIIIDKGLVEFDNIGDSRVIKYSLLPDNAKAETVEFVSENEKTASFEDDILTAVSVGSTYIYAKTDGGLKSERIKVKVNDNKEKGVKPLQQEEINEADGVAEENEKAAQSASPNAAQETATSSKNDSDTVYIGKTGTKYHKQSCSTLKGGGTPISLAEAKAQGREPCKRCGG